jgi:RecA/RadA recombinase
MKSARSVQAPTKAPTGAPGFDEITGGGLPHGRTTLLVGGPGSGKTMFALQFQALSELRLLADHSVAGIRLASATATLPTR